MQYFLEHTYYTKTLFLVYLKVKLKWVSCISIIYLYYNCKPTFAHLYIWMYIHIYIIIEIISIINTSP